ncbi:MAG: peptidylprolyl isomerase [Verrucomicrobiota bacterium]|nr:peptidylprolyl isomerase [Verrucomicrobiota bacterium]
MISKAWIRFLMAVVLMTAAGCGKKDAQVVTPGEFNPNDVAIWVDQVGIPAMALQREANRLFVNLARDLPPDRVQETQIRVLRQAVDNLVIRQLVESEMERSGILISQAEVEQAKKDLEKGLGHGRTLTMLIAEINLPIEELERNLRLDIFKNKVLKDRLDAALAEITEETAKAYYDDHLAEFTQPAGRLASHILVRVPTDADEAAKAKALAKAENIRTALVNGADFAKLAGEVSDCASRVRGGDLGFIPRGREAPVFEEAVYTQPLNQIGAVIESPVGFHIIKVTGEQEEKVYPFDEIKDALMARMKMAAQQQLSTQYIVELREKAAIRLDGPLAAMASGAEVATETASEESPAIEEAPPPSDSTLAE